MFSVIFPGQGSQSVGMVKELYNKFKLVKELFNQADEILKLSITKLILEGPKEELDQTENTQPAIFLVGYSIFQLMKKNFGINLNKASYFAGHSLGEYTALACAETLSFSETLRLLKIRGKSMQEAVPKGEGGMVAILGSTPETIEKIIIENSNNFKCYIANDNSNGQLVVSGKINDLDILIKHLKDNNIKSIKLSVSAPFHCKLMSNVTKIMQNEIQKCDFKNPKNTLISNVTNQEVNDASLLKELLVKQIESRVRWRENVNFMLEKKINQFIEIGPGKVLSGLVKRIDKNAVANSINSEEDIKKININD
ncbi:MAG TPA: ACP S-malonyltransferase [Candidatus Pelagibacter bacterium]|jgi:[acyl-carrier-protein] S-malonyltransferase|nr:[acyl-carrier-protein] S-malonyltransferase [Pelagibacteraceae bacterium]HJN84148.1 ACP S-malonyltransferase [Candidatus Pelagibacter bacterium]|tara:strand:- start:370 stop:1302 length:933 start_codon:yes stop_codon:yes gene_type:complete